MNLLLPAITLAKKEIWRFLRYWNDALVEPIVRVALYMSVFGLVMDIGQPEGAPSYAAFLATGLIVISITVNAFDNAAFSILLSKYEGNIVDLLMPPLNGFEIAFGYLAGAVTRGLAVTVVVLLVEWCFLPFPPLRIGEFFLLALLTSAFFGMLGVVISVASDTWDQMLLFSTYILTPLEFLSTAFFMPDRAGGIMGVIITYNPISWITEAFRHAMHGTQSEMVMQGWAFLIIGNLVLLIVCREIFKRGWRLKQ